MNIYLNNIIRFFLFAFLQVLVLNQIEIGFGIQIMVYPLFVLMLPVELGVIPLMLIAFAQGLLIDAMSNTYGLHTSAILIFAYARPAIFKLFAPRNGYEHIAEANIFSMGTLWFLKTFGLLITIHHLWFFMVEMFKLNEVLFVLQKTFLSIIFTMFICILMQYLFLRKSVENEVRR